jgi:hypothetical protein
MPHAVGGEGRVVAAVEPDRQRQDDGLFRVAQASRDEVGDVGEGERTLELGARLLVERRVPLELRRCMDGLRPGAEGSMKRPGPWSPSDGPDDPLRGAG